MAERDEQGVLRMPGVGVVADRDVRRHRQHVVLPVVLARSHEVGAPALETLVQQWLPRRPAAARAHQRLDRLVVVVVHRRHLELVPGRAVEVDHDHLVAQRLRDREGDRAQHVRQRLLVANDAGDVQKAAEACEGLEIVFGHGA